MREQTYWLGFSLFSGIGPGRFVKLRTHFESVESAWNASLSDLQKSGIGNKIAEAFISFRETCSLEMYEELLYKEGVSYVTMLDNLYPTQLRALSHPPIGLFLKGNVDILRDSQILMLGVVGTRKVTEYGRHITERLTGDLVDSGCVIVSGLAMGVDAIAHQTTLNHSGRTIAVLGCGVDCCTPRENETLYQSILAQGGLIVSEYGVSVQPTKGSFPSRNRIIAGLSQGIIVTEGAANSGALHTAHDAQKLGRPVCAVPGPVTSSLSQGTYQLIKQGSIIVSSAPEILAVFGKQARKRTNSQITGDTPDEKHILVLLSREDISFDDLVKQTNIPSATLGSILSVMEMKGYIKRLETGMFVIQD